MVTLHFGLSTLAAKHRNSLFAPAANSLEWTIYKVKIVHSSEFVTGTVLIRLFMHFTESVNTLTPSTFNFLFVPYNIKYILILCKYFLLFILKQVEGKFCIKYTK